MNYREKIMKEYGKGTVIEIARDVGKDAAKFAQLMDLYLEGKPLLTQRTAWYIREVGDAQPQLIEPYLKQLIHMLKEEHHDAVARNNLAIMAEMDIPEIYWDELYGSCFDILENPNQAVAIRVHAMCILGNIACKIPELIPELEMVIEAHLPMGSKGFQSRSKKVLKQLSKAKSQALR